jgi:uncharacterized protein with PQ loop repeat
MEIIGWLSSAILLATIGSQVHKQWATGSCEGVSRWLFVGQTAASFGFTLYSALLRNWVFVVTNGMLLLSAIIGWTIYRRNMRRAKVVRRAGAPSPLRASMPSFA